MNRFQVSAAILGLAASLQVTPALASPFLLTLGPNATAGGLNGHVVFTGPPVFRSPDSFIGPLNMAVFDLATHTTTDQSLFCTDIFTDFTPGTYTLSSTDLGSRIDATKLGQITALLLNAHPVDKAGGAAEQAAIWEIENETGDSGYDVTTGKLRVTIDGKPPQFLVDVAQDLKNVTDGTWTATANAIVMEYVAVNGHDQSFGFLQVTTGGGDIPTPEPATLGILGFGIVGLAAVRRRQPKGTI